MAVSFFRWALYLLSSFGDLDLLSRPQTYQKAKTVVCYCAHFAVVCVRACVHACVRACVSLLSSYPSPNCAWLLNVLCEESADNSYQSPNCAWLFSVHCEESRNNSYRSPNCAWLLNAHCEESANKSYPSPNCAWWLSVHCEESKNKGVDKCLRDVAQTQQQRPELPVVTLTWHAGKYLSLIHISEPTRRA